MQIVLLSRFVKGCIITQIELGEFPNIPGTVSRGSTKIKEDDPHMWGSRLVHFLGTG